MTTFLFLRDLGRYVVNYYSAFKMYRDCKQTLQKIESFQFSQMKSATLVAILFFFLIQSNVFSLCIMKFFSPSSFHSDHPVQSYSQTSKEELHITFCLFCVYKSKMKQLSHCCLSLTKVALGFYFFFSPLTVSLVGKYNRPLVTAIPIFLTQDDNFVMAFKIGRRQPACSWQIKQS